GRRPPTLHGGDGASARAQLRERQRQFSALAASSIENDPLRREEDLLLPLEARVEVDAHRALPGVHAHDRPGGRSAFAEEDAEIGQPRKIDPYACAGKV